MSESEGFNPENVNWDYDAPTHVVDFAQEEHENDDIDAEKYFDVDHEAVFGTPRESYDQNNFSFESIKEDKNKSDICENNANQEKTNNYLNESHNEVNHKEEEVKTNGEKVVEKTIVEEKLEKTPATPKCENNPNPMPQILPNIITPSRMANWGKKPAAVPQQKRSIRPRTRMNSARMKPQKPQQTTKPPLQKKRRFKENTRDIHLTVANTPEVLRRKRTTSANVHQSRMERELEEIAAAKLKAKQAIEESSKSFKKALSGSIGTATLKHTKLPTTCPKEFHFSTDKRLKSHAMSTRQDKLPSEVDFTKELRKHPPSPVKLKQTVPKPFKLSTNRKRKLTEQTEAPKEFVPLAKAVIDFQRNPSFKLRSSAKAYDKHDIGLTVAKTPKLQARRRMRPVTAISMKELEEKEIEEIKQYHFHAQPLNAKILQQPTSLPKVQRKETTKAVGFKFETDKRMENSNRDKPTEEAPKHEFKANPVPKSLNFEGCQGRIAEPKKPVEVKPFSFDRKDQERFAHKEEKIKEIIKKEKEAASAFRAQPIPSLDQDSLPNVQKKPATQQIPFKLKIDEIGERRAEEWSKQVEHEMEEVKNKCQFKANTEYTKVLYGKAFKPQKETKTIEVKEFSLHTDHRKEVWEENKRKKEYEAANLRKVLQEKDINRKMREKEEIEMLRKKAEHKANPIRHYTNVNIQPSTTTLTQPCSPKFSDRFTK